MSRHALYSFVNLRRLRRFFCSSMDTIFSLRKVPTKPAQIALDFIRNVYMAEHDAIAAGVAGMPL